MSAAPHVIRLRGPWQYEPLARTVLLPNGTTREEPGTLPPSGKTEVPADWGEKLGADFRGRVRFTRRFGLPTGLSSAHRVDLVIERVVSFGSAALNGESLGDLPIGGGPYRFDVTARLRPRNELGIEVEFPRSMDRPPRPAHLDQKDDAGGLGDVRLEIFVVSPA